MTTVLERPADGPGTHVLVIGVGKYRHLIGGDGHPLDNPMGLKQLSSPGPSALAFIEWALTLENPAVPLASLEAVISHEQPVTVDLDGDPVAVEEATIANIKEAFNRWEQRINTHRENVAVFFHCGHGIQREDLALLAEDFGASENQQWDGAYNFHKTYRALSLSKARGQFYFIDACREVPSDILELEGFDVRPLKLPRVRGMLERDSLILFATARDSQAFSQVNQPTVFTQALLAALQGGGSRKGGDGRWQVNTFSLPEAVIANVQRGNRPGRPVQHCTADGEASGTTPLHLLRSDPEVPAWVACQPPGMSSRTKLLVEGPAQLELQPGPDPWDFSLAAGVYSLSAIVDDAPAPAVVLTDEVVYPPAYRRTVEVAT